MDPDPNRNTGHKAETHPEWENQSITGQNTHTHTKSQGQFSVSNPHTIIFFGQMEETGEHRKVTKSTIQTVTQAQHLTGDPGAVSVAVVNKQ